MYTLQVPCAAMYLFVHPNKINVMTDRQRQRQLPISGASQLLKQSHEIEELWKMSINNRWGKNS